MSEQSVAALPACHGLPEKYGWIQKADSGNDLLTTGGERSVLDRCAWLGFLGFLVQRSTRTPADDFPLPNAFASSSHEVGGFLGSGGDTRLALHGGTILTRYGCSLTPRPSTVSFASSTASSISKRGFDRAEQALGRFKRNAQSHGHDDALDHCVDLTREELAGELGLDTGKIGLVFSPSGTDAQLQALAVAGAVRGTPLVSIVVGGDETGSGTRFTASGRHFSDLTWRGEHVCKDTRVGGMDDVTPSIIIPANGMSGPRSLAAIDESVVEAVTTASAAGQTILLHAMNSSKLGRRYPSDACLAFIRDRWPRTVQIMIDACQMRLSRSRLRRHLDDGDMIIATGSKFFSGPAFSGVLLIPETMDKAIACASTLPTGLGGYTCRQDWPPRFRSIRNPLEAGRDIGPWLRWEGAMAEISAYFAVPLPFRTLALQMFASRAQALLRTGRQSQYPVGPGETTDDNDEEFAARTIFPFFADHGSDAVTVADAISLYQGLNQDMSGIFGRRLPRAASRCYHIGQPVPVWTSGRETAVMRISADARFVVEAWGSRSGSLLSIERHLNDLSLMFDKLALLQDGTSPRSELARDLAEPAKTSPRCV